MGSENCKAKFPFNGSFRGLQMNKKAYGLIEVKSMKEPERVISGIASTIEADRVGDVVEPEGAKFKLPIPLLWQHRSDQPVGWVTAVKIENKKVLFDAKFAKIDEPGELKNMVDKAWQAVQAKLVRAVSLGFRPLKEEFDKATRGFIFKEWEWLELSLVTIPAHQSATIQVVRSLEAASGLTKSSGVSDTNRKPKEKPGMTKKTLAEQVAEFEAKKVSNAARMTELMEKSGETGTTLDAAEQEEYDTLEQEIESIDKHLDRLKKLINVQVSKAAEITAKGTDGVDKGSAARNGIVVPAGQVTVKSRAPAGTAFTRYVIALARAKGNLMQAHEIAKGWEDTPEVEQVLKTAVAAGTTTDSAWAGPLIAYQVMASEFIELLRPATIIGRIPGLRRVPFNIQMPKALTGSSVNWVGEGAPKPLTKMTFGTETLRWAKAAGIIVLTDELVRFSNPSAEAIVRSDLIASMAQFLDDQFLDPQKGEVSNVSPASITFGVTPVVASGSDAAAVRADVMDLFSTFLAANLGVSGAVWVMSPTLALGLSMIMNPLGQPEFPGFDIANGTGTFFGLPAVLSENISTGMMVLIKAPEVMLADDGQVVIDASREASLQMNDAPDNPPTASTVMVSMFQANMVALRAERFINWKKRRDTAVAYISNAGYGGAPGGSGT